MVERRTSTLENILKEHPDLQIMPRERPKGRVLQSREWLNEKKQTWFVEGGTGIKTEAEFMEAKVSHVPCKIYISTSTFIL